MKNIRNSLLLRNQHECKCVNLEKLVYVVIDNYLSMLYFHKGKPFTCTISLKVLENSLPQNFIRISRNCLVNIDFIDTINTRSCYIILTTEVKLVISKSRIKYLKHLLQSNLGHSQDKSTHSQVLLK